MKALYFAFIESPEVEGMFDENMNLIAYWRCDDAGWRQEYFEGIMRHLGARVVAPQGSKLRKLQKKLEAAVEGY